MSVRDGELEVSGTGPEAATETETETGTGPRMSDIEASESEEFEDGDEDAYEDQAGFTLLEVLIAVAILSISLTSLLGSQLDAIRAIRYGRGLSAAAHLAEYQLIEIEWDQKINGWSFDDKEYEGDFAEQDWPDVTYKCKVDVFELPDWNQIQGAVEGAGADTGGDASNPFNDQDGVQDTGESTLGAMGLVWPMVKQAIENSIRKASCEVFWTDGKVDHSYKLVTFWTDARGLTGTPHMGGEFTEEDDDSGDEPGGTTTPGGSGGAGAGGSTTPSAQGLRLGG